MPATRKAVPKRIEKKLFQEVGSRCPLCGESDVARLQIHHIKPYAESAMHDPEDMLVLCANCQADANVGTIPVETLYEAKRGSRIIKLPLAAAVAQHVQGSENIVAGRDVNIRMAVGSRRTVMPTPASTVCDDPRMVGYLQYLAKRYNQFREWDARHGGEQMKHGFIHGAYARHMKYAIRTTPIDAFAEGVEFLQGRILGTKLGRIMNSRRQRVFSLFEDFDGKGDLSIP